MDFEGSVNEMKQGVRSAIEQCDKDSRFHASTSQEDFRLVAPPGSVVPNFGEFEGADDGAREAIKQCQLDAYHACERALNKFVEKVNAAYVEKPNTSDLETVKLALSREVIPDSELRALYSEYGGNYQLAAAIYEKAKKQAKDNETFCVLPPLVITAIHPEDATQAIGEVLHRYDDARVIMSADLVAETVADKMLHVDVFGHNY